MEAGWVVQSRASMNVSAGRGVAVREFPLASGLGFVDYMLFVDGKTAGVLEAKPAGHTLTGVEVQARNYADGLPPQLKAPIRPLPFLADEPATVLLERIRAAKAATSRPEGQRAGRKGRARRRGKMSASTTEEGAR